MDKDQAQPATAGAQELPPLPEPVAWMKRRAVDAEWDAYDFSANPIPGFDVPLYTAQALASQPPAGAERAPFAPWVKESIDGEPVTFSDADVAAHQEAMRRDLNRPPWGAAPLPPAGQPETDPLEALRAHFRQHPARPDEPARQPSAGPSDEEIKELWYQACDSAGWVLSNFSRALLARHGHPGAEREAPEHRAREIADHVCRAVADTLSSGELADEIAEELFSIVIEAIAETCVEPAASQPATDTEGARDA